MTTPVPVPGPTPIPDPGPLPLPPIAVLVTNLENNLPALPLSEIDAMKQRLQVLLAQARLDPTASKRQTDLDVVQAALTAVTKVSADKHAANVPITPVVQITDTLDQAITTITQLGQ